MTGAADDLYRGGAGDAASEYLGVRARHDLVMLAPQQQCRGLDQVQALFDPGIAERPEGARRGFVRAGLLDRPFRLICPFSFRFELVPALGIGTEQPRHVGRPLRPRVGNRVFLVEEAPGRDQRQSSHRSGPDRRHFGRKRPADLAAGNIGAVEPGLQQQLTDRQQPIEMAVEHGMAAVAAWEARERGHDHRALARQCVEERDPSRQAAKPGGDYRPKG